MAVEGDSYAASAQRLRCARSEHVPVRNISMSVDMSRVDTRWPLGKRALGGPGNKRVLAGPPASI